MMTEYKPSKIFGIPGESGVISINSDNMVIFGKHDTLPMLAVKCHIPKGDGTDNIEGVKNHVGLCQQIDHKNAVKTLGFTTWQSGAATLMKFEPGTTLESLLRNGDRMNPAVKLQLILDVVSGISHLHNLSDYTQVTHGNIELSNILVTHDMRCKIAGLSRLREWDFREQSCTAHDLQSAKEKDVHAVGKIMHAVLAESPQGATYFNIDQIPIPDGPSGEVIKHLKSLAVQCVSRIPTMRPAALNLEHQLISLEKYLSANKMQSCCYESVLGSALLCCPSEDQMIQPLNRYFDEDLTSQASGFCSDDSDPVFVESDETYPKSPVGDRTPSKNDRRSRADAINENQQPLNRQSARNHNSSSLAGTYSTEISNNGESNQVDEGSYSQYSEIDPPPEETVTIKNQSSNAQTKKSQLPSQPCQTLKKDSWSSCELYSKYNKKRSQNKTEPSRKPRFVDLPRRAKSLFAKTNQQENVQTSQRKDLSWVTLPEELWQLKRKRETTSSSPPLSSGGVAKNLREKNAKGLQNQNFNSAMEWCRKMWRDCVQKSEPSCCRGLRMFANQLGDKGEIYDAMLLLVLALRLTLAIQKAETRYVEIEKCSVDLAYLAKDLGQPLVVNYLLPLVKEIGNDVTDDVEPFFNFTLSTLEYFSGEYRQAEALLEKAVAGLTQRHQLTYNTQGLCKFFLGCLYMRDDTDVKMFGKAIASFEEAKLVFEKSRSTVDQNLCSRAIEQINIRKQLLKLSEEYMF